MEKSSLAPPTFESDHSANLFTTRLLLHHFLNEKDFTIAYYENNSNYKLVLTPKNDRMKKRISKIELVFDKTSLLLEQMSMHESADQKVVYVFDSVKTNETIADSKFNQLWWF